MKEKKVYPLNYRDLKIKINMKKINIRINLLY